MSFQANKRTPKQTPESSQTKKASKETSELLQPEIITEQSVEPSKAKETFKETAESSKAKRTHKTSAESSQAKITLCQQTEKTKRKSSSFKMDTSEVNKTQEDPNLSSGSESSILSKVSHPSLDRSNSSEDESKVYCICRKPFGNRFMIACDFCGDWLHGSCVGITEHQGRELEKLKKDYMCPKCTKAASEASLTDKSPFNVLKKLIGKRERKKQRAVIRKRRAARLIAREEKAKRDSEKLLKKRARKRKRKGANKNANRDKGNSEIQESTSDKKIKFSKNLKTTCSEIDEELSEESETEQKNGEFSTETADLQTNIVSKGKQKSKDKRNKSTPKNVKDDKGEIPAVATSSTHLKTAISPKITVIAHSSIKKNISSKESPKKFDDQHPTLKAKVSSTVKEKISKDNKKKNNCVSCEKIPSEGSCYCTYACLEKHVNDSLKLLKESKTSSKAAEACSEKLVLFDRFKGTVTRENISTATEIIQWLKSNPNYMIACTSSDSQTRSDSNDEKCDTNFAERKEESDENARETVRLNVRKTLKNILEDRCKNADDLDVPEDDVKKIAMTIEEELYSLFRDNSFKYRAKYRSLMFNIKDPRNQGLFRKILKGNIPPDRLVKMSTEELASVELAKWREQENQHCLDMIKRVQLEQLKTGGGLLIKKTHKGEVEIEGEATSVIEQDTPKNPEKTDGDNPDVEIPEFQEMAKDTTHLHRSHLFDLNCKICTGKMAPPPTEDAAMKKIRVAHSISVDVSPTANVDSVEKSVSRAVDGKSPSSSVGDDSVDSSISKVSMGSKKIVKRVTIASKSKKKPSSKISSVWKGFIFMQDVAKFVTNAYKVSGHTERLCQDIPDTIQVCGRIIPDQVWDYLSKIKQSGNKELIIIRFQAANEEEAATYNSFYNYLNTRKRYGVVNNYSKKIKDFYILPLAATSPVPIVLMPFEGPGLPSHRPHLLLGVIVRHKLKHPSSNTKKPATKQKPDTTEHFSPPLEPRSYTPPLSTLLPTEPEKSDSTVQLKKIITDESKIDHPPYVPEIPPESNAKQKSQNPDLFERSYTPPLDKMPKSDDQSGKEEDKPYDPEQEIPHIPSTEQKTKSDYSKEINEKNSAASPNNLEKHKKLLDELTRQFEEADRQVIALQQLIEPEAPGSKIEPPGSQHLDVSQVSKTGMTSFLDLPVNLQEILNVVKQKTFEQDNVIKKETGDVDMRNVSNSSNICNKGDVDIHPNFNTTVSEKVDSEAENKGCSQEATPPPPPDDDSETLSVARPSDPRIKLRTTFQEANVQSDSSTTTSLSSMSALELVERAQKQLAEMEAVEQVKNVSQVTLSSSKNLEAGDWSTFKEPPPPGIEPTDIHSREAIFPPKLPNSSSVQGHTLPPSYASTSAVPDSRLGPHFTPGVMPPPFPPHLPPVFPMPPPPPEIKTYPPPTGYLPQTLPSNPLIKKDIDEQWATWQLAGHPLEGDWKKTPPPPPPWSENWKQGSSDYYSEQETVCYSSEQSSDYYRENYEPNPQSQIGWERGAHRHEGRAHRQDGRARFKHFERGGRWKSNWRGRRRPFSRGKGNNN